MSQLHTRDDNELQGRHLSDRTTNQNISRNEVPYWKSYDEWTGLVTRPWTTWAPSERKIKYTWTRKQPWNAPRGIVWPYIISKRPHPLTACPWDGQSQPCKCQTFRFLHDQIGQTRPVLSGSKKQLQSCKQINSKASFRIEMAFSQRHILCLRFEYTVSMPNDTNHTILWLELDSLIKQPSFVSFALYYTPIFEEMSVGYVFDWQTIGWPPPTGSV